WIERVYSQRYRVMLAQSLVAVDDPGALKRPETAPRLAPVQSAIQSVRNILGATPLHSAVTPDYFKAAPRSSNYRRALQQFREVVGDKEIGDYTADDCWTFRNWLSEALDEKKGELLSGRTKNNKLSAVSSLFNFAIERRYRNDNPMQNVKWYPKN